MSDGPFSSWGRDGDLFCKGPTGFVLWCAPWLVFAAGYAASPGLRTVLWTSSLSVVGVACLVNASRCGRVHCRFTGPFFIVCALASLAYGLGMVPLGPSGWKWIGCGTIVGGLALACIPEMFLGRYRTR